MGKAVYNLTTPEMPEGNGVLEAIQKPLGANTPDWLEKVVKDEGQCDGELRW